MLPLIYVLLYHNYLEYYHRIPIHYGNGVTSGTSIFGIYQHMIPNRSGLELNLTETLFFFWLSFTLSVSNIHNPNYTPRLPAPPYLRTRTSHETQSLVSLDARRFSSKAVQLFSPKRVNLLICWLLMALCWAHPWGPRPGGITITPITGCA